MILVTDGENNAGSIDPATAANLAQEMGIKIYTIGVGSDRMILPVRTVFGGIQYQQYEGGFNESLLKQIAETTGGRYYRAAEPKALEQIFHTIDELEKPNSRMPTTSNTGSWPSPYFRQRWWRLRPAPHWINSVLCRYRKA